MKDFIDTIKGNHYNIEQAKQLFIIYTLRHNGHISERFKNLKVRTYQNQLPNGSRAEANTNIKENKINMLAGSSIVTFFHECKHLADGWKDSSGMWHANWENEDDYTAQMTMIDDKNNVIFINRGIKGLAMREATAELYASKMFWELNENNPQAIAYTANNRKIYDEEIITLKKICTVLGINEDKLLSWKSENNYGRKQLENLFTKLTGNNNFWTLLEERMDYVSMPKFIRLSHPNLKIHETALKNAEIYRKNINELLEACLRKDRQQKYYLSMGCSISEFEKIYQEKEKAFNELNKYMNREL